jgi:transposase-like protein
MSQSLTCKKCGYNFNPRKLTTRYKRQCPQCKSTQLDSSSNASQSQTVPSASITAKSLANRTSLPKAIYDLVGILDAVSPENAIMRAFELCRKLTAYKFKYNLESLESVFNFLERETLAAHEKANKSEAKLKDIFAHPELIYYEVGGDLDAVHFYEAMQNEGYPKGFLDFVNDIVSTHFRNEGLELKFKEN